jgi:gluconolactonase
VSRSIPRPRGRRVGASHAAFVAFALTTGVMPLLSQTAMTEPTIDRKSPKLDALIAQDAKFEKLSDGHKWVEGPVWSSRGGFLLFSDIPNNVIQKWEPTKGISEFLKPSGYHGTEPFKGPEPGTNGLTFDADGRLVACQHGDRRVARWENNAWTALAEKYEGKRLNSPNDVVVHSSGALYFTDPPYGLPGRWDDPQKELPFQGVYRRGTDGTLTLLTKELYAPNGLAFSPDEKTLYVAQSDPKKAIWMTYPVKTDGTVGEGRVFADATSSVGANQPGLPDGMKVDTAGNIWTTAPGGIWIFTPAGEHLGTIATGVPTANLAWGDDGSTLYITANHAVWRVKTKARGRIPG